MRTLGPPNPSVVMSVMIHFVRPILRMLQISASFRDKISIFVILKVRDAPQKVRLCLYGERCIITLTNVQCFLTRLRVCAIDIILFDTVLYRDNFSAMVLRSKI